MRFFIQRTASLRRAASCLEPVHKYPERKRDDQKAECQMTLIQIYIKIPESPVFICRVADKALYWSLQVSVQRSPADRCSMTNRKKLKELLKKKKNTVSTPAAKLPVRRIRHMIQKDQKSQKRKNTYHIIRKIQTQSQKFEISHKKLEHKMVLYILPAKMRILCREIVPQ